MSLTRRYLVSGVVQGVFYRASTVQQARRLGLCGWVRNLSDGRVETVARGDESALAAFENWLWQGPPQAQVTEVQVAEAPPATASDFVTRPTSAPP